MTRKLGDMSKTSTTDILGVPVSVMDRKEVVSAVMDWIDSEARNAKVVLTPTTEQIVMANDFGNESANQLMEDFGKADLNLADTTGIVWADRVLSRRRGDEPSLEQRVSGVDVMQELFSEALKVGKKVFFLGGRGNTGKEAAEGLKRQRGISDEKFKKLVDWDEGSVDIENESEEEAGRVIGKINSFGTDLLFVAFGAPFQEQWVTRHRHELKVKVAMVVGGSFDVLAGKVSRAPLSWRKIGLEWLWRLLIQPWRWKRQLRLLSFVWMVFRG